MGRKTPTNQNKMLEIELDTYNLFAQIFRFTREEDFINYIVGLPFIFGIMLFIYALVKYIFAGASKPDKERAKRLIWSSIIIVLIVIIGYSIFIWVTGANLGQEELPSIFE